MTTVLGVDVGGSSSRWLLLDETGLELASGQVPAFTGHLFGDEERAKAELCLSEIALHLAEHAPPRRVVAGVTGLSPEGSITSFLQLRFAYHLGVLAEHVHLYDDAHIAYTAAFPDEPGLLIYAGTGSVGYYHGPNGTIRVGGYGCLIDDAGSGFAIGQAGLRQVLRWTEASGVLPEQPLAKAVYQALGTSDWPAIREHIYGGGRSAVAALAPAVVQASEEGDEVAARIVAESAQDLVGLAKRLLDRLDHPSLPLALAGGVVRSSPQLVSRFGAAFPEREVRLVRDEPVRAAAQLAFRRLT